MLPFPAGTLAAGTHTFWVLVDGGNVVAESYENNNVSSIVFTVRPLNYPPVALSDNYTVDEDTTLTAPAPGVLGNDSDADTDNLTAALVDRLTEASHVFNMKQCVSLRTKLADEP